MLIQRNLIHHRILGSRGRCPSARYHNLERSTSVLQMPRTWIMVWADCMEILVFLSMIWHHTTAALGTIQSGAHGVLLLMQVFLCYKITQWPWHRLGSVSMRWTLPLQTSFSTNENFSRRKNSERKKWRSCHETKIKSCVAHTWVRASWIVKLNKICIFFI